MSLFGTPLLLVLFWAAEDKPAAKLPLGKETTYVTEPLDKDGYIDYEAALNDRLGKGITPEQNANVLLWKALGPRPEGGAGMPPDFFKRLGIDEPPREGDYFIGLETFQKDHLKLGRAESDEFDEQKARALKQPWVAKDYPRLAAWLTANEKPLAVVMAATKRPAYFNPLVSPRSEKGRGMLVGALVPGVQKCREFATALALRAMLRVGEKKFDEAWQDLLACHRLGRLVGRGATLIDALVGIVIEQTASRSDLGYLAGANLSAKEVQDRLKDLQGLPPLRPLADTIDVGERIMFLDIFQSVRRGGVRVLEGISGGAPKRPPNPIEQIALQTIDWEPGLRSSNRWYDRLVAAMRLKNRTDRQKELDQIDQELKALRKRAKEPETLAKLILASDKADKTAGQAIGDILISLLLPASRKVQEAHDRTEQTQRNLSVAFALSAFHRDHGRYPAKLAELAPQYLATVPDDLFSGKGLVYRPSDKGYLFYSVGVNGKDEGGQQYDDDPRGDDISVRMPLPELKRKE
jgi:hypothetical protein